MVTPARLRGRSLRARTGRLRRASVGGAGLIGALCLLIACAGEAPDSDGADPVAVGGPIASSPEGGLACLQAQPGDPHDFTLGLHIVVNTGSTPAEIRDMELIEPHGLTLRDAWLVPTNGGAIGNSSTFPPPADLVTATEVGWERRTGIPGAQAAPGERYNVVLQVAASTRHPSSSGIRFVYEAAGEAHAWQTDVGFTVKDEC